MARDFLDETFPNPWIGRDGPTSWSTRSPYSTPLDFFFWFYIKNTVFAISITDVEELKTRIQASVHSVTEDTLKNNWRELDYRSGIFRATKGRLIAID